MDLTLRDYRKEDFNALWKIDQECFPPGISYSRMELALYIRRSQSLTLIFEVARPPEKGTFAGRKQPALRQVLGFIVAQAKARVGHIITIDVLKEGRRAGVGSALLAEAEKRLGQAGCHEVYLETAVDNPGAIAFYKRHQYFLEKTIPGYYANGVDALVLRKDLLPRCESQLGGPGEDRNPG